MYSRLMSMHIVLCERGHCLQQVRQAHPTASVLCSQNGHLRQLYWSAACSSVDSRMKHVSRAIEASVSPLCSFTIPNPLFNSFFNFYFQGLITFFYVYMYIFTSSSLSTPWKWHEVSKLELHEQQHQKRQNQRRVCGHHPTGTAFPIMHCSWAFQRSQSSCCLFI